MASNHLKKSVSSILCILIIGLFFPILLYAQKTSSEEKEPWTYPSVVEQLALYPRDPYLQFVAMQLAYRETGSFGVRDDSNRWINQRSIQRNRNANVDLFSIFSGGLAIQESLQLDALTAEGLVDSQPPQLSMNQLQGPTIQSHPWQAMLAGRKPKISSLAMCVPDDFLFLKFGSVSKMMEATSLIDTWGAYVVSQVHQRARSQLIVERIKRQLAVETNDLLRPVYDSMVSEFAIASSDVFFREGTDVSLLMELKEPESFRAQMDKFLLNSEKATKGIVRSESQFMGVPYTLVASPDRTVHVYSAYPRPDLHLRTNSEFALKRIIESIQGKTVDGKDSRRLGESDEFAYIRTIMPEGAEEEDGLVYMSDPFIRRLMGPQVKLTQRRRLICYNHLRMLGHASIMHATEHGQFPETVGQLHESNCLPEGFGDELCRCPDGGQYSLSGDGVTGVCSHHGHVHSMIPCSEIPITLVTGKELEEYGQFLDRYNQYWRTFFDPIAIRVQIQPKSYRIETVILPLIDNSIYTSLASMLGGETEQLDRLPVPKNNIFSVGVKFDKNQLLERFGLQQVLDSIDASEQERIASEASDKSQESKQQPKPDNGLRFRQFGIAMHNFHDTYGHLPPLPLPNSSKGSGLSWRVHLLPFLEHADLYSQFNLDEPWDSEHNRKLITQIPDIYRTLSPQLTREGKTTVVLPVGEATAYSGGAKGFRFSEFLDGLSNTILLVQADEQQSVVWTKPDDLKIDPANPAQHLAFDKANRTTVLLTDGSLVRLPKELPATDFERLFTRGDGTPSIDLSPYYLVSEPQRRQVDLAFAGQMYLRDFLLRGISDQISLNVCDADPLVDFNLSRFLGMMIGSFRGGGGQFNMFDETGLIALLAVSLNVPVYVAIPVNDIEIVDRSLQGLDRFLAVIARQGYDGFGDFFEIEQDYYRMSRANSDGVRSYGFRFGPVKWRFFWTRIGKGLYVASKPYILDDLFALEAKKPANVETRNDGPKAHAMIRVRPKHWQQTLPQYRIGWAENQRLACLNNVGPLSSIAFMLFQLNKEGKHQSATGETLEQLAERALDARLFCPDGGIYEVTEDGHSVRCTKHGTAMEPRQPDAPNVASRLGALLQKVTDVTLAMTFLEDGLHAVVTMQKE